MSGQNAVSFRGSGVEPKILPLVTQGPSLGTRLWTISQVILARREPGAEQNGNARILENRFKPS